MVRPDTSWSVNTHWHSMVQKNCREWLKMGTDGRATSAFQSIICVGKKPIGGKKLLLVHLR